MGASYTCLRTCTTSPLNSEDDEEEQDQSILLQQAREDIALRTEDVISELNDKIKTADRFLAQAKFYKNNLIVKRSQSLSPVDTKDIELIINEYNEHILHCISQKAECNSLIAELKNKISECVPLIASTIQSEETNNSADNLSGKDAEFCAFQEES